MKVLPRSLSGRLLAGAAVFVAAALILAAVAIGFILERFVHGQIDQLLDTQIGAIALALTVDPAGHLVTPGLADGPPFDRASSGWYWEASANGQAVGSASLGGTQLAIHPGPPPPRRKDPNEPFPAEATGPKGEPLFARIRQISLGGQGVTIIAAAPAEAINRPLREALLPLIASLAALGAALMIALIIQVRFGLRPLRRLEESLQSVRDGRLSRIPTEQPAEVSGLVRQMNDLLDQNEQGLERARRHVANLAHGLKTPLATLAVSVDDPSPAARPRFAALVEVMDRLIRHHLARARAAALGGPVRARTKLADRLSDIGQAMTVIHREKQVTYELSVSSEFLVACESQDLDELFGNLLDNAFRYAHTWVSVHAQIDSGKVSTTIEDDGPGLAEGQVLTALQPGFRFDETATGYGFGLPIALEIAQLYGGDLVIARSATGGLSVKVDLPRA